eukprot:m.13848 g.13848  ORF g.13848 m.13848 type:complete len:132 (+) comp6297_c0_seq2:4674-5069(+)
MAAAFTRVCLNLVRPVELSVASRVSIRGMAVAKKDAKKEGGAKKGGGSKAGKPTAASACKKVPGAPAVDLAAVCRGANFLEGGKDPAILADNQYPEWLFTLLDPRPPTTDGLPTRRERKAAIRMDNLGRAG